MVFCDCQEYLESSSTFSSCRRVLLGLLCALSVLAIFWWLLVAQTSSRRVLSLFSMSFFFDGCRQWLGHPLGGLRCI